MYWPVSIKHMESRGRVVKQTGPIAQRLEMHLPAVMQLESGKILALNTGKCISHGSGTM